MCQVDVNSCVPINSMQGKGTSPAQSSLSSELGGRLWRQTFPKSSFCSAFQVSSLQSEESSRNKAGHHSQSIAHMEFSHCVLGPGHQPKVLDICPLIWGSRGGRQTPRRMTEDLHESLSIRQVQQSLHFLYWGSQQTHFPTESYQHLTVSGPVKQALSIRGSHPNTTAILQMRNWRHEQRKGYRFFFQNKNSRMKVGPLLRFFFSEPERNLLWGSHSSLGIEALKAKMRPWRATWQVFAGFFYDYLDPDTFARQSESGAHLPLRVEMRRGGIRTLSGLRESRFQVCYLTSDNQMLLPGILDLTGVKHKMQDSW